MEMHDPMHPGEFLTDVYLTPYSLTVEDLARNLQVEPASLEKVIARTAGVDAALAIRLAAVLGGSARFWMTMQASYDIACARAETDLSHLEKMTFPELEEVPHPDKYYA